jgi:putative membrane protein
MLSGLFGASSLIISIKNKVQIPEQKLKTPKIKLKNNFQPFLAAMITSPICCFLPGIGSGQASVLGSSLINSTRKNFLILLGATNTIVLGLSFIVFYTLNRTRTGMAATVNQLIPNLNLNQVIIILITIIFTGIISFYLTLFLGKYFSKKINKINYTKISLIILFLISLIVLIFSGILGFFIFIISTATGIFGILSGARRINLMGCLIIPVILFYV